MTEATPYTVSACCRTLAIHRADLAKHKSVDQALAVQRAKATLADAVREVRAGFKVVR
jgi:hypothetical protein